jgi:hypothetical protein
MRVSEQDSAGRATFDAVPYQFHKLNEPLSKIPRQVVDAVRGLYEKDSSLFRFRGARLLQIIFPEFSGDLEEELVRRVRTGREDNIDFVIDLLSSYDGEPFIHRVAQEIVRASPVGSPALISLSSALQSTGVVTGEFGFVNAFKQKIEDISKWPTDGNEKIKVFVDSFVAELELRIAAETRRAEEDIALRRHQFGEDASAKDRD